MRIFINGTGHSKARQHSQEAQDHSKSCVAMGLRGIFVMLGRFAVCIFRHTNLLKPDKSGIRRKRENLQELRGLEDITL